MFLIHGAKELSGKVKISGSKNAVLPILAASLLVRGKITLHNVPAIGDVETFLKIFSSLGVKTSFSHDALIIDTSHFENSEFDFSLMRKVRVSILLLAPILYHFGEISIPIPGGCNLGKRPVDAQLEGLKVIGYDYKYENDCIYVKGQILEGDKTINGAFSVTSTENIIVANVMRKGTTRIKNAAIEPHVMNLIDFMKQTGAKIEVLYDHTIVIDGVDSLDSDVEFTVISDYIQSGTYIVLAALTARNYIDIENACIDELYTFLEKIHEAGVKTEDLGNDVLRVYRAHTVKPVHIQTNIFPGFPTDLQSPFTLLMTQASGASKIHEILFEGRLSWMMELEKVGGNIAILNPHEAMIFGPTKWKAGAKLTSWDLRAGAAVVIAALLIDGETQIENIDYIKRGYDDIVHKLQDLGADIQEITK